MENIMTQSIRKKPFLATKISQLNNFLFKLGKSIYSLLLAIVFIVFVISATTAILISGGDISSPEFVDDEYEAIIERVEISSESLSESEKEEIKHRSKMERIRNDPENIIKTKYGKDIKEFQTKYELDDGLLDLLTEELVNLPEDIQDEWLYGLIVYVDDGYKYFSDAKTFNSLKKEYSWKNKKVDIINFLYNNYKIEFSLKREILITETFSANQTRMFALSVAGGSFLAFLIAVLISMFIQIEQNLRVIIWTTGGGKNRRLDTRK